jgi:hypothetical protein
LPIVGDVMKLKPGDLLIVALNLVPLAGVWLFDWHSFDLIFLYWMENVVIGAFVLLRMVVRPYHHVIEIVSPLFFAPFFAFHYGMFCFVHGSFVVSMFGTSDIASGALVDQTLLILDQPGMAVALLSLVGLQAFDWLRDTAERGLGGDGIKDLMVAPYRRIVVLHLVIIGGGFALTALGDPRIGLIALVVIKTASDLFQSHREKNAASDEPVTLTEAQLAEMHEQFAEPVVKVNGKEKRYASFAELRRSKEFRMLQGVLRLMGEGDKLRVIERYFDQKIAKEQSRVETSVVEPAVHARAE